MRPEDFLDMLESLIGQAEAARCVRKICTVDELAQPFFGKVREPGSQDEQLVIVLEEISVAS